MALFLSEAQRVESELIASGTTVINGTPLKYGLDDDGNTIFEKTDVKVVIGKLPIKWINVRNILNGIANSEMGFEPFVDQRIYFLNPKTNIMFHMYDDRGCLVWSDVPDKIRSLS